MLMTVELSAMVMLDEGNDCEQDSRSVRRVTLHLSPAHISVRLLSFIAGLSNVIFHSPRSALKVIRHQEALKESFRSSSTGITSANMHSLCMWRRRALATNSKVPAKHRPKAWGEGDMGA